jgi:hypothetical protein
VTHLMFRLSSQHTVIYIFFSTWNILWVFVYLTYVTFFISVCTRIFISVLNFAGMLRVTMPCSILAADHCTASLVNKQCTVQNGLLLSNIKQLEKRHIMCAVEYFMVVTHIRKLQYALIYLNRRTVLQCR